MLLKNLLPNHCGLEAEISSIETDSRLVKKGSIFFALQGSNFDGAKFIDSAFKNGAIAVVCGTNCDLSPLHNANNTKSHHACASHASENQRFSGYQFPTKGGNWHNPAIIKVENVYQSLIKALQNFYPNLPKNILAITGTNGKTSVAYFAHQMQKLLGKKSAFIGTIGIKTSDLEIENSLTKFNLTTPDIVWLYQNLAILAQNGINDVAIEASSIGLKQKRLAGLKIGLGAFTNFTQDHLDYHQTMQKYFDCKMLLFSEVLQKNDIAILNADIGEFEEMKAIASGKGLRVFSYSAKNKSFAHFGDQNLAIDFINQSNEFKNFSSGIGFLDANILCALLSVVAYYQPSPAQIELLISNLGKLKPAEGRMQKVATLENGSQIFIDYAHTPDALLNVLENAKKIPHNNLYVLFGCGGDRDKSKRPKMGKIACDLADFVIISDDNPRTENAENIRKDILQNCDLGKIVEIGNRKEAILQTIKRLKNNDILIIAGKGHEKYQIIGDEKFEFDEEKIVNSLTRKHFGTNLSI